MHITYFKRQTIAVVFSKHTNANMILYTSTCLLLIGI